MREMTYPVKSGWPFLGMTVLFGLIPLPIIIWTAYRLEQQTMAPPLGAAIIIAAVLMIPTAILIGLGLFMVQPNEARVFTLFGKYEGTTRQEGLGWANPFFWKRKISTRLRNLNGEKLKVNDREGNPIEIALVLVWRVRDTFAAFFDVDEYQSYVKIQSEAALRHLATAYPYDTWGADSEISLRGNIDEVSEALEKQLQERLTKAGVEVLEARLSHLAYAPEIAEAMLRRQQASAIIAARTRIVEGAVGMVRLALEHLQADNIVELDGERKAAMVSNLLVVLCGESNAQPVINAGTLYQ